MGPEHVIGVAIRTEVWPTDARKISVSKDAERGLSQLGVACEGFSQMQSWLKEAHQHGEFRQDSLHGLHHAPDHRR